MPIRLLEGTKGVKPRRDVLGTGAQDIRDHIFAGLGEREFVAALRAAAEGVLAGVQEADRRARDLGLRTEWFHAQGDWVAAGTEVARVAGRAKAIAQGEECLLGCLGKASGIATAARRAVELAAGRIRVVSGAWKKMPPEWKGMVRSAVQAGGMPFRILDEPFIYLDKNYLRMLGGIEAALEAVRGLEGVRVVQVRGEEAPIAEETARACRAGAGVIMVDTGDRRDAVQALEAAAPYPGVQVAFAGGIRLEDIPALADLGLHILDIGTAIVDAPLLEVRLDVVGWPLPIPPPPSPPRDGEGKGAKG